MMKGWFVFEGELDLPNGWEPPAPVPPGDDEFVLFDDYEEDAA